MNVDAPLLSVIVPTHNVRVWVTETLRSILSQDVEGMEVIVVDDHSEDGTVEVLERIADADRRVIVVRADERGGGSARNEGVRRARGRYLVFADGDDIVPEGAYRSLVTSLKESGSEIAVGDYLKFSPDSTWRPTASMPAFGEPVRGVGLTDIPTLIFSRPCWNKAFDRGFWEQQGIRFPDVPRSNDIVPMVTAYVKAKRIDVVEDVVYLYRDRPGGTSMTSRTSSSVSFLSYMRQERICAELVASVGSPELMSRYSSLIHDRDGFFHVQKFLASWTAPQDDDDEVVHELSELLALVSPAASWIDVRKRLTMRLVASGQILAARAVAQGVDGGEWRAEEGLTRLRAVLAFLEQLGASGDMELDEGEIIAAVSRTLATVKIVDEDVEAAWIRLAVAAEGRFGVRIRDQLPELHGRDIVAAARHRRDFSGSITPLFGRDPLRIHSRGANRDGAPVLWSARVVVEPRVLTWRDTEEGAMAEALFPVGALPQGELLRPAFRFADGTLVTAHADSQVPEYRAWDNVLYEQAGSLIGLQRRAHWILRAPRRLALTALATVRRLVS